MINRHLTGAVILMVTLGALCAPLSAAQPSQKMVRYDHDIYTWLDLLYLDSGTIAPTQTRPLSVAELSKLLNQIDPGALSGAGKTTYRLAAAYLREESVADAAAPEVRFGGSASLEFYGDTNDDYTAWNYGFTDRQDLLSLQPEVFWGDWAYATADIDFLKERTTVEDTDTWTNSWGLWDAWDVEFPYRGFFSLGGDLWNIQAGRDVMTYGLGETGQMLISDASPYQDYIKVSSLWQNVHFNFTFHSFEPLDYDGSYYSDDDEDQEDVKYMIGHKVEFKLFGNLRVGLCEMMLVGGEDVQLRDLNPFNFYHNQFINRYDEANSIAQLELEYSPFPGTRIYGNYIQDQYKTSYEIDKWPITDTDEPNAVGLQGGIQQTISLNKGFLTFGTEYTHAGPWLYLEKGSYNSYSSTYKIDSQTGSENEIYTDPIGYPEGNDCEYAYFYLRYREPARYSVEGSYSFIRKGELSITDYLQLGEDAFDVTSPSGVVETRHVVTFSGDYNLRENLLLYGQIDSIFVDNYDNISDDWMFDLQTAVGITASF